MRIFSSLTEADSEIRRDLQKSPEVRSSRVQGISADLVMREALNYSHTLTGLSETREELADFAVKSGRIDSADRDRYAHWLEVELDSRLSWQPGLITEKIHPALASHLEGEEPSYAYTDRLATMVESVVATLRANPDSRRAYWPIFERGDAQRAMRMTRVPCSLGYWFVIRHIEDVQGNERPHLHMVYQMRSCDFDTFWLSDIWLARQIQKAIATELRSAGAEFQNLAVGQLTQSILSFHSIRDSSKPVY